MKTEVGSRSARDVIAVDCASLQVSAVDITELEQGVLALGCPGLNFLGSKVGLRSKRSVIDVACKCPSSLHVDTIVSVHIASLTCDYTLVQTARGVQRRTLTILRSGS
jgi:hypothetical protein